MRKLGLLVLSLVLLGAGGLRAAPNPSTEASVYLSGLSKTGHFSGVVLIARDGKPIFEKAYGNAVQGWRIPNSLHTRWALGQPSSRRDRPAGMSESGYASTLAIVPKEAEGYARDNGMLRHRDYFDRSLELGAGGVYSTIGDLLKWNVALDSGKLLNPASRKQMFKPDKLGDYGFGWFITNHDRLREFHEGSDPGFAAFEARYPDDHLLIVVLSNFEDASVRDMRKSLRICS